MAQRGARPVSHTAPSACSACIGLYLRQILSCPATSQDLQREPRSCAIAAPCSRPERAQPVKITVRGYWRFGIEIVRAMPPDAASVAGLKATTEAMVAETPDKKAPPMPPGGGGRGDMDFCNPTVAGIAPSTRRSRRAVPDGETPRSKRIGTTHRRDGSRKRNMAGLRARPFRLRGEMTIFATNLRYCVNPASIVAEPVRGARISRDCH